MSRAARSWAATGRAVEEAGTFLLHVLALLWPGVQVSHFQVHRLTCGDITAWSNDELGLLIEEGRRQIDRQHDDLARIQTRAQFLFTVALALLAVLVSGTGTIKEQGAGLFLPWGIGLALVTLGLLGSASILSVRSPFGIIDSAVLTRASQPVLRSLATDYADVVGEGENTLATKLTLYRDAVLLLVLGGALQAVVWLLSL